MPDITTLTRLAEILGVDLNYFSTNFRSAGAESNLQEEPNANFNKPSNEKQKRSWNMPLGNWENADFLGLNNLQEKFSFSNMKNCKFIGSNMSGLELKANHIDSYDFSSANLSRGIIQGSHLTNNIFEDSF